MYFLRYGAPLTGLGHIGAPLLRDPQCVLLNFLVQTENLKKSVLVWVFIT